METEEKNDVVYAMPTLAMLPANNFKIHIDETRHTIELPRKGKYVDVDSSFFTEEDGEFIIADDTTFYIANMTKVLFAVAKYPSLADNQLFCPIFVKVIDDVVQIQGQIVTMLGD